VVQLSNKGLTRSYSSLTGHMVSNQKSIGNTLGLHD
jgi:hypothetical protein